MSEFTYWLALRTFRRVPVEKITLFNPYNTCVATCLILIILVLHLEHIYIYICNIILVLQTSRTIPYKVNNAGGGGEEPQVNGNSKNYFLVQDSSFGHHYLHDPTNISLETEQYDNLANGHDPPDL